MLLDDVTGCDENEGDAAGVSMINLAGRVKDDDEEVTTLLVAKEGGFLCVNEALLLVGVPQVLLLLLVGSPPFSNLFSNTFQCTLHAIAVRPSRYVDT